MENRSPDPLDALIDAAVKTYSDTEPLNGLEERILNRVAFESPKMRIKYGLLVAIAATLALSCFFIAGLKPKKIEAKKEVAAFVRVAPEASIPPPVVKVIHRHAVRSLPKRDVFPTPQPPTAQELALLRFVERDPKAAAQAFAGLQQMDAQLDIAPLDIKPLETDSSNN